VGNGSPAKIMIVEDDELCMKLINDILEGYGYSIFQARGGEDALRIAYKERPDLILLDIGLPGLSGLDVTRILKKDDDLNKVPIVAVTAFAMPGDEHKIRQAGIDFYVSKPISISMVRRLVKEILEELPS
jgi:two-component system, cell cycle response regulator DivK